MTNREIHEIKPGYYAVIPADVRYDDRLPPNAKLLYGEITALATAKGYCYASNEYFCKLYGFSERTVSRLIGTLESSGYIRREVERDQDGTVTSRKIWIGVYANDAHPVDNFVTPSRQFCQDPPDKIVQENNTEEYIIPPISPKEPKHRKERRRVGSYELDDGAMDELIQQNVGTLGDAQGWSRDEKNAVYELVLEFYGPRACSGKPPQHTARGVNGLFRNLASGGSCSGQMAMDMLLTAIERGWTSVYHREERKPVPTAPVPGRAEGLGESW